MQHKEYRAARKQLSLFVFAKAIETAKEAGTDWQATPDAPATFQKLVETYDRTVKVGHPLPVSSLYCDTVIYTTPGVNHAMRFWHDMHHIKLGLNFGGPDELELGLWHVRQAELEGFKRDSLECRMLEIDTVGQNYLLGIAGRFPIDQAVFVRNCIDYGIHEGVLIEARC